ncbi:MAG: VRR-NUC domain-containing protein, partial [Culicoidibacterales bacterium]
MTPEQKIQNEILIVLSRAGWLPLRLNSGTFKSFDGLRIIKGCPKGTPDLIAFKNGKSIFIEVKTKHGRVSAEQSHMHKILKEKGMIVHVV